MNTTMFLEKILPSDLVLTANRRLSVYIKQEHNRLQLKHTKNAWDTLRVMPLTTWIEQTWCNLEESVNFVLSDFQELLLWEEVLQEGPLMNVSAISPLAKDSWQLLKLWQLRIEDLEPYSEAQDIHFFIQWCVKFNKKRQELSLVTRSELPEKLTNTLKNASKSDLPGKIYFVGFDDFSPSVKKLQGTLSKFCQLENVNFVHYPDALVARTSFDTVDDQLKKMVIWSFQRLKENKNVQIGCVVPNLTVVRNKLERIFEEILISGNYLFDFNTIPFNISAANPLSHYSIIQVALSCLLLNQDEIEFETFSDLLRSPFFASNVEELSQCMMLDVGLRSQGFLKFSIVKALEKTTSFSRCNLLRQHLEDFIEYQQNIQETHTLIEWASHFSSQLSMLGWPGGRSLSSEEYQLVERFKKTLNEFSSASLTEAVFTFNDAHRLLKKLIENTLFQPQSENSPIQVLGILESSGLEFDHLWVCNLNDEVWPSPANPNPFIPIQLQQNLKMPHSTAERELAFSLKVTERLVTSAPEVILSYAKLENDRQFVASSFITPYPEASLCITLPCSLEAQIYKTKKIESILDEFGPPIAGEMVSGGSGLLKAQAVCPFQAFARYRLHARPLEEQTIGLSLRERGILLHEALAFIWKKIKTQLKLIFFDVPALEELVNTALDFVMNPLTRSENTNVRNRIYDVEKKRLRKIIMLWLEKEKHRAPFEVMSCEQRHQLKIGKLELNLQVDRVDQLENGSFAVIDYKTGKSSLQNWFSDRPSEPQLPLYALLYRDNISALLFAQLRANETCFSGLASSSETVDGVTTFEKLSSNEFDTWPNLIAYWERVVNNLAVDFCEGKAMVDPKDQHVCSYCHLRELCRTTCP